MIASGPDPRADGVREVKSAGRTLDVLEELAQASTPRSLGELSRRLSIPKSSLHGLLRTMERRRWVEPDETGLRFALGVRAMQVAGSYLDHDRVVTAVRGVLVDIANETGETVQMARLDGPDVVYLAQRLARHPVGLISSLGQRLPAHATALGKAVLSCLDDDDLDRRLTFPLPRLTERTITDRERLHAELRATRERGYAVDEQEAAHGLLCFAVPLAALRGDRPTDAISVSVPAFRLTPQLRERIIRALRAGAEEVARGIGGPLPSAESV